MISFDHNLRIKGLFLIVFLVLGFLCTTNVYAETGGWLGEDNSGVSGSIGGSTGSGSISERCKTDQQKYFNVDCTGVSWIYYKYVGGESLKGQSVDFAPGSQKSIDGACAVEGGGFWHFGINALAYKYTASGKEYGYFGDYWYVNFPGNSYIGSRGSAYLGSPGEWGHRDTYNMKTWRYYKNKWGKDKSGKYVMAYTTKVGDSPKQSIYKKVGGKYVEMYRADSYSSDPDENYDAGVFKAYRTTYKRLKGTGYTGSQLPDSVYGFCSWETASGSNTLTGKPIDTNGNDITGVTGGSWSSTVAYGNSASISSGTKTDYVFKGWATSRDNGKNGIYVGHNTTYTVASLTTNITMYAVYEERKELPCGGTCGSTINIEQSRNNSDWTKSELYVKPGQTVYLRGSFNPQYQDRKDDKPDYIAIDSDVCTTNSSGKTLKEYYEKLIYVPFGILLTRTWGNGFYITGPSLADVYTSNSLTNGIYYGDARNLTVKLGSKEDAKSKTGVYDWGLKRYVTPNSVEFKRYGSGDCAIIHTDPIESSTVSAYSPYNFVNEVSQPSVVGDGSLNPGEFKTFSFNIKVNPKYNSKVGEKYATAVHNPRWKLEYWYEGYSGSPSGEKSDSSERFGLISDYSSTKNATELNKQISGISIPSDMPAGSKFCVRAGVYPANSGSDDNYSDEEGNREWAWSSAKCFEVSKKPTFQVWGSSIYTTGSWGTEIANKEGRTFGSWVELGLISEGTVTGFSSGASTGYASTDDASSVNSSINNPNNVAISGLGGSSESGYCKRSLLSFANSDCSSGSGEVGNLNGISNALKSAKDRLLKAFDDDPTRYNLTNLSNGSTSDVGGLSNVSSTIVIKNDGNFKINSDITYKDRIDNVANIPKVIIYATENITIGCDVHRVDAILIADGDVTTCESPDYNSSVNSNQLKINGAIIAKNIKLNRTYGAASGNNSIIPAEIINYDSSLYLWAYQNGVSGGGDSRIVEKYQKELPPRY